MSHTQGRCPDCGESVMVETTEGEPGKVMEHGCASRACEYPGCSVSALKGEMVEFDAGEWFCPGHGLLLAAKDLVLLYRVEGEADWTAISEIISETLPDLVAKAEAREPRET